MGDGNLIVWIPRDKVKENLLSAGDYVYLEKIEVDIDDKTVQNMQ